MAKSNIIYKEQPEIYAKYYHPQSGDFLEYNSTVVIKDSGKQPITMKLTFVGKLITYMSQGAIANHQLICQKTSMQLLLATVFSLANAIILWRQNKRFKAVDVNAAASSVS